MCNATRNKQFGLGLLDDDEAHRSIVYMIDNIYISCTDVYDFFQINTYPFSTPTLI